MQAEEGQAPAPQGQAQAQALAPQAQAPTPQAQTHALQAQAQLVSDIELGLICHSITEAETLLVGGSNQGW